MDIIKVIQDVTGIEFTLCFSHLYNPPPPPPPPNKNLFRVGNIEHKQASEQPNKQSKPTNIKNSRTKGPNRRLHAIVFS